MSRTIRVEKAKYDGNIQAAWESELLDHAGSLLRSVVPGGSNCVGCQAVATAGGCQGVWSRSIAFSIVSSLRIQATSATFFALPAAHNRW